MNCKKCGKKAGVFSRVKVGDDYFCRDCYRKMRGEREQDKPRKWKRGIPKYEKEDLLTRDELVRMAMDAVRRQVLEPLGDEVLEEFDEYGQAPNFICARKGRRAHITVRLTSGRDEIKTLLYPERRELLKKAQADDALCYYADVTVTPADPARAKAGLYLKDDEYRCKCENIELIGEKVTQEWIRDTLKKIDLLDPNREKKAAAGKEKVSYVFIREEAAQDYSIWEDEPTLGTSFREDEPTVYFGGWEEDFEEELMQAAEAPDEAPKEAPEEAPQAGAARKDETPQTAEAPEEAPEEDPAAKTRPTVKYSKEKISKDSDVSIIDRVEGISDGKKVKVQFALPKGSAKKKGSPGRLESPSRPESSDRLAGLRSMPVPETFQERLLSMISEKGMSNPEFYNAAMIDRKLFSAIKNNKDYKPKKETAVACCFGLRLGLKEAENLLGAAGYKLSLSILWDRIIYFCLDHRITDLDVVNELLYEEKQKCIGAVE